MKKIFLLPFALFISVQVFAQLPNLYSIYDTLTYTGDPDYVSTLTFLGNNGTATYPAGGMIGLYFSLDTLFNTLQDSLVLSFVGLVDSIPSGSTYTFLYGADFCSPFQNLFPSYVFGSSFYILYELDYGNLIPESNENDNVGVFHPSLFLYCITGINDLAAGEFSVSPNPATDVLHIQLPENQTGILQLIDFTGRIIYSKELNNTSDVEMDVSNLADGIYLLSISGKDWREVKKVVIADFAR